MSGAAEAMQTGIPEKPAPTCYVPTEADKATLSKHFDAVHRLEIARRWYWWLSSLGGWGVAAGFALLAFMAMLTVHDRPVPRDRIYVGFTNASGTYQAPKPQEDWTPSEREIALTNSIIAYVRARQSYTWESANFNYHVVSPMSQSGPASEQQRYQDFILGNSPEKPEAKLGKNGSAWIEDIHVFDRGPSAREVRFVQHTRMPSGALVDENMLAIVTFDDNPNIPMDIRQQFDPAGIVITKYDIARAPGGTR